MGLNDFILNCEKDNKELRKDIEYYKNKSKRLEKQLQQSEEIIEEANKLIDNYLCSEEYCKLDVPLIVDFFVSLKQTLNKYKKEESE